MKKLLILTALAMALGSATGCGIWDRWCGRRGAAYDQCQPTYSVPVCGGCGECATCIPSSTVGPGPVNSYVPSAGG